MGVAALPAASEAVQVTVVSPRAKVAPDAGVQVTSTEASTLSEASTVKVTALPAALVACWPVMSSCWVMTGFVVSTAAAWHKRTCGLQHSYVRVSAEVWIASTHAVRLTEEAASCLTAAHALQPLLHDYLRVCFPVRAEQRL